MNMIFIFNLSAVELFIYPEIVEIARIAYQAFRIPVCNNQVNLSLLQFVTVTCYISVVNQAFKKI